MLVCARPSPALDLNAHWGLLLNILLHLLPRCPRLLTFAWMGWLSPSLSRLAPTTGWMNLSFHRASRCWSFLGLLDFLLVPSLLRHRSLSPQSQSCGTPSFSYQRCPFSTCHSDSVYSKKGPVSVSGPAHRVTILSTKGQSNTKRLLLTSFWLK